MKARIKFHDMQDIKQFATISKKCKFDVDIQQEHEMINGKSLSELEKLRITDEMIVYYNGISNVFETMLGKYRIN